MNKVLSLALLTALSIPAFAADYFVVVPVPNRTSPVTVTLGAYTLPGGIVGVPYANFDFKQLLSVTGDAAFNAGAVTWAVSSGALPQGMSLSAQGVLSGTPATAGSSSFVLSATYKTRQGTNTYQVVVNDLVVTLAAATLPVAPSGVSYRYDFNQHLNVTGDPTFDPSLATWTLLSGGLPPGMSFSAAGILSGKPTEPASTSFELQATYKNRTGSRTYALQSQAYSSCKSMLEAEPGKPSGWYTLDVDGSGPVAAQSYYCDMVSSGGGWTRVVRQTESHPVVWTGGVNGSSYALAANTIPAHNQVGFGKDEVATAAGYFNWTYKTGDIYPAVTVAGLHDGAEYRIGRVASGTWAEANPYKSLIKPINDNQWGDGDWRNGLLVSRAESSYTWAFCVQQQTPSKRGCAMLGSNLNATLEPYAWTVWVR